MADRDWTKARVVNEPQPGFYKVRLVAKGWKVPAWIFQAGDALVAIVDGEQQIGRWRADDEAPMSDITPLMRVHLYGEQIDQAEWDYLNALREFCRIHKPDHPCCHPGRPIDIRLLAPDDF